MTKVILVVALLAVACGSDSSTTSADGDGTDGAGTIGATTSEAPATTSAPATTESTEADPSDPVVVAYCEAALEDRRISDDVARTGAMFDPVKFEEFMTGRLERMAAVTPPPEIAADFETLRTNLTALSAAMEEAGWDINADTPEIAAISASAEAELATERIDAFEADFCPPELSADGPAADIVAMLESESGRQFVAETLSESLGMSEADALCLIDNTPPETIEGLAEFAESPGAPPDAALMTRLFAGLDACGISIDTLF